MALMEEIYQYHFYINYKNSQTLSDQLDTQFPRHCLRNSN